jgi:hypothetical protein
LIQKFFRTTITSTNSFFFFYRLHIHFYQLLSPYFICHKWRNENDEICVIVSYQYVNQCHLMTMLEKKGNEKERFVVKWFSTFRIKIWFYFCIYSKKYLIDLCFDMWTS